MHFAGFKMFETPNGKMAVHPDAVVSVYTKPDGATLHLTTGGTISLSENSLTVAKRLWGLVSQTDNGFFNSKHVVAVTPIKEGARLHLTGGTNLDTRLPVEMMIQLQQETEVLRRELMADRGKGEE